MLKLWDVLRNVKTPAASIGGTSVNNHSLALSRRSGFEIAGVLILLAVLFMVGANLRSANPKITATHNSSLSQTSAVQTTPPATNSSDSSASSLSSDSSSNGVSSNVSSSSNGNGSSTSMTVNGQAVNVPANGSTHQTINTPSGPVSVSASQSHTSTGNSFNSSVTSTHANVNSSSESNVTVSGGSSN